MLFFRGLLIAFFVVIAVYTAIVIRNHGVGLLPIFFNDITAMTWPGQFNLDFMTFLVLSATWLAWRNNFTLLGILLALCGALGGMFFLSAYLLYLTYQTKGDIREIMLGKSRA
ncbi:MAG: hypothetical protein MRY59_07105 [Aquisalinus sp.]|nr:hypothetical protein [Aquisalinus sp.]